ncbi:MAG: RHS repeat domain-containing protein, partial [Candidatus Spyradosoma sp.]
GENRPIRFENAATQTVVECAYDSQGRRFEKKVTVAGTLTLHERYVYDGYLQIAAFDVSTDAEGTESFALKRVIFWDPEEPTATRPLAINVLGDNLYFPTIDLTKNVCELVDFYGNTAATYDYAPFGAVTTGTPSGASVPANPFQWSSEVYDSELDLVYYNYRHYSPSDGRFLSRDPIEELGGRNLYAFAENSPIGKRDILGRAIPQLGAGPDVEAPQPPKPDCTEMINGFMAWYSREKAKLEDRDESGKNWVERLPRCPSRLLKEEAREVVPMGESCFYIREYIGFKSPDENEWSFTNPLFFEITQIIGELLCGMRYHPKGVFELRTKDTSKYDGHGNQCIYDSEGILIQEIPSAGTVDWSGPGGNHLEVDVSPFKTAVEIDRNCGGKGRYVNMYYEVRPSW